MKLSEIQVNTKDLTIEQIHELVETIEQHGFLLWQYASALVRNKKEIYFTKFKSDNEWYIRELDKSKYTVSFEEFIERFKR